MGTRLYILLWMLVYLAPILGWLIGGLITAALGRSGTGNPWRRAAFNAGEMAIGTFAIVVLLRIGLWAVAAVTGGPVDWFTWLIPAWPWHLQEVALMYAALPLAALTLVGTPTLSLVGAARRSGQPSRVPLGIPIAIVLVLSALVMPWLARFGWSDPSADVAMVDLFVAIPMSAIGLALWTFAARQAPHPPQAKEPQGPVKPLPPIDVPATWRALGALDSGVVPTTVPATNGGGGELHAANTWRDAGGFGPPPESLEHLIAAASETGQGWLVGDLDDHGERRFLSALLHAIVRQRGLTALVVSEDPQTFRDDVIQAIGASGGWDCGPIVAGHEDLRAALAGGRLPAIAFIDVASLSAEGIRALAGGRDDASVAWARGVGVVMASRIDRGRPLDVTHRMFTLRRLQLALRAASARFSVVATGIGGVGTRSLTEQAFPGLPIREVPYGPRASAAVSVWLADPNFVATRADSPWVRRVLEPVADTGRAVSVGDPSGRFDRASIEVWGQDVDLVRSPALYGAASAGALSEAWLVAGFRSLPNRQPSERGETHHALWSVARAPTARFLTAPGAIANLIEHGRLTPPRPLVGYANRLITRAHLQAALREGRQDLPSLVAMFGPSLVEQVVQQGAGTSYVMRPDGAGNLRRVQVAAVPPDPVQDPVRGTVTGQIVRVIHRHTGETLTEVDRALAPTRFYPKRVFAVGDQRYQVELHRYDERRGVLPVEPVATEEALTRPIITFAIADARVVEAEHEVRQGDLTFSLCGLEATVTETVSGAIGESGREARYETPVHARYRTRVRALMLPKSVTENVLFHLARSLQDVLVAHLLGDASDFDVTGVTAGLDNSGVPTLFLVDRHVQGIGVLEAADDLVLVDTLQWVRAILKGCSCNLGCAVCTPADVLERGPDKVGVLRLLGD
ncbi:MAG: hypothetical protein ACJAZO_004944 [Myxococcota bacterium]|jgi:hypothetical protein